MPAKGNEALKPSSVLLEKLDLDFSAALRQLRQTGIKPRLATVIAVVNDVAGFVEAQTVTVQPLGAEEPPVIFRVGGINVEKTLLVLEPELINLALHRGGEVELLAGSIIAIGGQAAAHLYGVTDWQEMILQAPADADLTDPGVWVRSNAVGNPAGLEKRGMSRLLGGRLAGLHAEQGLMGDWARRRARAMVDKGNITQEMYNLLIGDLGSVYFMEGTPVRLQDRRGGDQSLLVSACCQKVK